jgi:hypothetical protein
VTPFQRQVLARVVSATIVGHWCRAANNGERVTLASLYRLGLVNRIARRGADGESNAAYEYQAADNVLEVALEMRAAQARAAINQQPK